MLAQRVMPPAPMPGARPGRIKRSARSSRANVTYQLRWDRLVDAGLMDAGFLPQSRNFVFNMQFAPFEFSDLQIVGRWVGQRFANFLF
jgi:hypothetical protein